MAFDSNKNTSNGPPILSSQNPEIQGESSDINSLDSRKSKQRWMSNDSATDPPSFAISYSSFSDPFSSSSTSTYRVDGNEYQALLQRTNTLLKEYCPDDNWDLRSMYLLLLCYQQMHNEHQTMQLDAHEQSKECKSLRELLAEQSETAQKEIEGLKH
ncbi:hypothetical protein EW146_g8425 [Bondarzewia mesenterica]|uniref:Uncharacterized protein n=1 Tax=Bondarzewia mesenterica TaxID=1095465 RepID=A0A4V3XDM1_9AGAM|nr:hypothetical protein EW146_g8425 [Bondarzewia mesenterica]